MKPIFCILVIFIFQLTVQSQNFVPQAGDLIFQESCTGNMNSGIKDVTHSIEGYNFTHVGIVYIDSIGNIYVIEATHPTVCMTPLNSFLQPEEEKNCPPISVVARLKENYQQFIIPALRNVMDLIGKEYDDAFDLNNDQYYCSELIYLILFEANNKRPVFELNKMTFKSESTGDFSPYWVKHFEKQGIPIPEGEWGINPGAMSRSNILDIVHYY